MEGGSRRRGKRKGCVERERLDGGTVGQNRLSIILYEATRAHTHTNTQRDTHTHTHKHRGTHTHKHRDTHTQTHKHTAVRRQPRGLPLSTAQLSPWQCCDH